MSLLMHRRRGFLPGEPSEPPPSGDFLLGVGSISESLVTYPRIPNTTEGDWYVDASRPSSGNGQSLSTAFKTIQEGLNALQDGQTLLVKGGTYNITSRMNRNQGWNNLTRIMAYGNDRPILTGVGFSPSGDSILRFQPQSRNELWHRFYITDAMTSGQDAVIIAGENTVLSEFWISHVMTEGVYIAQGSQNVTVQDCAVWRLGDGTSAHTNTGDCFVANSSTSDIFADGRFIRCFGANGPDDVYDLWGARDFHIVDSVAYGGGRYWNGNPGSSSGGDGAGFKLGGEGDGLGKRNTITGSISIASRNVGIKHNHNSTPQEHTILNNTSYNNGSIGVDYGLESVTRNNISYLNSSTSNGSGGTVTNNSWQLGIANPMFADIPNHDYSLAAGSPARGAGYQGVNLGASEIALKIAKTWMNRDLTDYADVGWEDVDYEA